MNTLLDIIKEIECLLWAITILVAIYMILKNYCLQKERFNHERQMKDDAFEREMQWFILKNDVSLSECQKKKDELQKELNNYKNKEEEINKGTESLKIDKEQFEKKILEAKIKAYEEIIKNIR